MPVTIMGYYPPTEPSKKIVFFRRWVLAWVKVNHFDTPMVALIFYDRRKILTTEQVAEKRIEALKEAMLKGHREVPPFKSRFRPY